MANYIDVQVGKCLRQQRIMQGKSQSELAGEIGVTFQQLQKYETGMNRVSASRLYLIAKVLRVPVSYFFQNLEDDIDVKSSPDIGHDCKSASDGESLELMRVYYGIQDIAIRKRLLELMKSVKEAQRFIDAPAMNDLITKHSLVA